MQSVKLLVEKIGGGGFVVTAIDEVGKVTEAAAIDKNDAVRKVKQRTVRLLGSDVEFTQPELMNR